MNATESALYNASSSGKFSEVRELLQTASSDEVNYENFDLELSTHLMAACRNNHVDTVFALLTHPGIDVNIQNKFSQSALMIANEYNRVEIVEALLVHPTLDINLQTDRGETVLMRAASWGHLEIVRALLGHPHIDVHREDQDGLTALNYAHTEEVGVLLFDFVKQHPKPAPDNSIAAALAESNALNKDLQTTIDALSSENVALKHTVDELNAQVAALKAENTLLRATVSKS